MPATAFLTRLKNSRVVRGISANVYSQAIQTVLQLVSVPVLATHWGLQVYGAWLVIFTVPNYLAFADFGFAAAAANDMTVSIARGERAAAVETFHAVRATMVAICAILLCFSAAGLQIIPDDRLAFVVSLTPAQTRHTILMLAAYGILSVQNSVSLAAFRSIGQYATGTYLNNTLHFAENIGALFVVFRGGSIQDTAATYLLLGIIGIAVRILWLRATARWLVSFSWRISFEQIRRLLRPALAVLALPMAQALFLQGTVAVVGLAAGAANVPAFTAVRTISRIGVQLTMIVNHAVLPEFTMAAAAVDHTRRAKLAFLSIASSAVILVPMFFAIVIGGPLILHLWTHGAIHAPYALIVLMACTMVVNGTWVPISNLIFALNRHSQYSYYYLVSALGSVLLSYPLVKLFGSPGAAISLLALDIVMFTRVWAGARTFKVFDANEVLATARSESLRLRSALASFARRRNLTKPP